MEKHKMQNSIRKKRNEFLLGIVSQFKQSDENQTLFNCYDYVKIVAETSIDSFINTLTSDEREQVKINVKTWFLSIESLQTFAIFLSNNGVEITQK